MVIFMPMRGAKIMGLGIDGNRELVPMRWGAILGRNAPATGPRIHSRREKRRLIAVPMSCISDVGSALTAGCQRLC